MLGQQRLQLLFYCLQIGLALKYRAYLAVPVDEISQGKTEDSAVKLSELFIAHGHGIVQTKLGGNPAR